MRLQAPASDLQATVERRAATCAPSRPSALDLAAITDCTFDGREDYDDGFFVGRFDTYSNCGGTGATSIVVAAHPPDGSYGVLVIVRVVTEADLVALDEVLRTFNVVA